MAIADCWHGWLTMTLTFPRINDSHSNARNYRIDSQTPENASHFAMQITLFSPLSWKLRTLEPASDIVLMRKAVSSTYTRSLKCSRPTSISGFSSIISLAKQNVPWYYVAEDHGQVRCIWKSSKIRFVMNTYTVPLINFMHML